MGYTNSSLVDYTDLSPNNSGLRTHGIDRITPHCVVGQVSVERLGEIFEPRSKEASCNYGIGEDGRVLLCVEEKNHSWCSSSFDNDDRAITIECASDSYDPYAFKDVVYQKLVKLCADICKRNGKTRLIWLGNKDKTLNYTPDSKEMILTVHRWFDTKACPGDWMYSRMGDLASKVTALLSGSTPTPAPTPSGNTWTGGYPSIPSRGYYLEGDGYETNIGYQSDIKLIQNYLNWAINAGLDPDGFYGTDTSAAVAKFQTVANIKVDGSYGTGTLAAAKSYVKGSTPIMESWTGKYPAMPSRGYYLLGDGYETNTGMKEDIRNIQRYMNWALGTKLDDDGNYGKKTEGAVYDFQALVGITKDGSYGQKTLSAAKTYKKKV